MAGRTPVAVKRALRSVGADLTAWRRLQRLTVDEVADRAGVSSRTVSRLEDGEGATLENLMRIARALGVLDALARSVDPYSNDVGRLRADESLPQRVRRPSRPGPAGTRADKDQS